MREVASLLLTNEPKLIQQKKEKKKTEKQKKKKKNQRKGQRSFRSQVC
jgi:hypothetical protein